MNFYILDNIIDTVIPIEKGVGKLDKIKNYLSQAKVAAIILGIILIGILIALIVLIVKKNKK